MGTYMIYKKCYKCKNYNYSSNDFLLDLSKKTIGDLTIDEEYFSFMHDDGYNYFKLNNFYKSNRSFVEFGKFVEKKSATIKNIGEHTIHYYDNSILSYQLIGTELIKFTTKEKIIDRLNKLMCFI